MLSLSQLTPVAYLTDGDILCIECGDKAGLPVSAQLIEYNLESDFEDGCWYCSNTQRRPPWQSLAVATQDRSTAR